MYEVGMRSLNLSHRQLGNTAWCLSPAFSDSQGQVWIVKVRCG